MGLLLPNQLILPRCHKGTLRQLQDRCVSIYLNGKALAQVTTTRYL